MQRVAATRVAGAAAAAAAAAAAGKPAESAAARDETSSFELIRPAEIAKARRSVEAVSSDEEFETTTSPDGSSWIVPKPEPAPLSEEEQAVASAAFETAAELAQDPALQRLVLERLGPRVQRNLTMAAAAPAAAPPAAAETPADDADDADDGWGHPFSPDGFYYVGRPGDESSSVASSFVVGSELFEAIIADVDATAADANGAAASASALSSASAAPSAPADEKEGEEEARGVPAGAAVAAVVLGITVGLITCALLTRLNPAAGKAVAKAAHAALKKAFSRSCRAF